MRATTKVKTAILAVAMVFGIAGAAYADSGTFTRQDGRLVFFYETKGDAVSNTRSATVTSTDYLCQDAPGATSTWGFSGLIYRQTSQLFDPSVADSFSDYNDPRLTKSFTAQAGQVFKARSIWNAAGSLSGTPSAYVAYTKTTTEFQCDLT